MSESFLSQEEVDALLEGVTGESQKTVEEAAEHGEVRAYNISSQERIVAARRFPCEAICRILYLLQDRMAVSAREKNAERRKNRMRGGISAKLGIPGLFKLLQPELCRTPCRRPFLRDPRLQFQTGSSLWTVPKSGGNAPGPTFSSREKTAA